MLLLGSGGRGVVGIGGFEAGVDARAVGAIGVFWGFAPEELEEAGVARAHVVGAHRGFLEAVDGLIDHVADEGAFFFCHCCC